MVERFLYRNQVVDNPYISFQSAVDFGKILTTVNGVLQNQAIQVTRNKGFEAGVLFIAHKITPTPQIYAYTIDVASRNQFYHLGKSIKEIEEWRSRMLDYGVDLFGAAWINFNAERIREQNIKISPDKQAA